MDKTYMFVDVFFNDLYIYMVYTIYMKIYCLFIMTIS
jgi:hypothetical protein